MAVDMFLKLGSITGESVDASKSGEIDILAWSWGGSQSGDMHSGGGGGAGKASFQDISITKYLDIASPILLEKMSTGEHFPGDSILTVRKAGGSQLEYMILTLTDCMVTSYSTGGSGGEDRLTENVTFSFAKFKVKYTKQDESGAASGFEEFTFNIKKNIKE
jgi:type VI secretion system secreted protein Hcp